MDTMKTMKPVAIARLTSLLCLGERASACGDRASVESVGSEEAEVRGVTIEYLAHASFVITSPEGDRVLIDPYASRVWLGYDFPEGVTADAVLVTHPHYDHDAGVFRGADFPWPSLSPISDPGSHSIGSMQVVGVEGKHADPYGMEFGQINTIFVIEVDGLRIAHLGDNGPLTPENVVAMGRVDILMIPGDALYHIIDAEATGAAIQALDPRIVIPMHYRIGALETEEDSPSDLGDVEPWLEGRFPVRRLPGNVLSLTAAQLPVERTYTVLQHSPEIPIPVPQP
jgi:L-ascorbate metabolism protein UlaG (beta-lactamase superfamily)